MNLPLVTIGAINYNNSPYVLETLDSIAAQTYSEIELVIVDDASTDDSLHKIEQWLLNYSRPYKLVVHSQNEGVHKGYESVINNASGKYISFIATDDLFEPGKISEQVSIFQNLGNNYGVVYGDMIEINEIGQLKSQPNFALHKSKDKHWQLPQGQVFERVSKQFLIYVQSTLIRASLLKTFSFQYKAFSEDWQIILFLARHSKFFGTENIVVRYRRHTLSLTSQNLRQEKHHLWCKSNALMFHEAYHFPQNTKKEKKVLADCIKSHLLNYAYQPSSKYKEVIKTWRKVCYDFSPFKSGTLWCLIQWQRIKLIIKQIIFQNKSIQSP